MDVERGAGAGGESDGPRVVGGAQPEQDGSIPRRDRPAPAPWTREVPPDEVPENYVAKPIPTKARSIPRLVVATLLMVILVDMLVGFVVAYVRASEGEFPLLFGSAIVTSIIEVVGWWVVYRMMSRR